MLRLLKIKNLKIIRNINEMEMYEKYDQGNKNGFCSLAKSESTLKKSHQFYNCQLSKVIPISIPNSVNQVIIFMRLCVQALEQLAPPTHNTSVAMKTNSEEGKTRSQKVFPTDCIYYLY